MAQQCVSSAYDSAACLAGPAPLILKQAIQWLQHSALRQEVEATLQALASSSEAPVQFSWLPVPDRDTSVALLRPERGSCFSLIITEVSSIVLGSNLTDVYTLTAAHSASHQVYL